MDFDSLKDIKLLLGRQGGDVLADIEREIALLTRPDLTSPSQATVTTVFTDADEQERLRLEAELESDLEKLDISLMTEEQTKGDSSTFRQNFEREIGSLDFGSPGMNASTPRRMNEEHRRGSMNSKGEYRWNFEGSTTKSFPEDTSPERRGNSLSEEKIKLLLEKINHFNFGENPESNNLSVQSNQEQPLLNGARNASSHISDDVTIDLGPELNDLSFSLSHTDTYNLSDKSNSHKNSVVSSEYQRTPVGYVSERVATISREKLTSFEMNTNEEESLRRKIEVLLGVSKEISNPQEASQHSVGRESVDNNGMSRIHEILDEESLGSEPGVNSTRPDESAMSNNMNASGNSSTTNGRSFKSGSSFMKEIERQRELSRNSHKESDDDFNLDDLRELILQDEGALAEKYHSPNSDNGDIPSQLQLDNHRGKAELSFNSVSSKPRIDFGSLLDLDSSHPSDKKSNRSDSKYGFDSNRSNSSHFLNSSSPQEASNAIADNKSNSFSDKHSIYSMDEIDAEFAQDLRGDGPELPANKSEIPENVTNTTGPYLTSSTPNRNNHAQPPQSISVSGFSSYTEQLPSRTMSDPGQSQHQALVLETLQSLQKQVEQLQMEKTNGTREVEQLKSKLEKHRLLLKKYEKSQQRSHRSSIKGMTSSQIHDREMDKKKLQQLMAEKEHLHHLIDQLQSQNEELDRRNELDKNILTQNLVDARDEALEAIRKFEEQLSFKNKEIEMARRAANGRRKEINGDTSIGSEISASKSAVELSDVEHLRSEVQFERRIRKKMDKYGLSRSEALKLIQKIIRDRKLQKELKRQQNKTTSQLSADESRENQLIDNLQELHPKNLSTSSDKLTHISSSKLRRPPSDPFIRSDNNLFRKLYQSSRLGSEGNSALRQLNQSHSKPSLLSDTYRRQELDFFDHMAQRGSDSRTIHQGYVEETPTRYKGKSSFSLLHNNSSLPREPLSKPHFQESDTIQANSSKVPDNFTQDNVDENLKSVKSRTTTQSPKGHEAMVTSTPSSLGVQSQSVKSQQVPTSTLQTNLNGSLKKDVGTQSSVIFSDVVQEPKTKDACVQNSTFFGTLPDPKVEDDHISNTSNNSGTSFANEYEGNTVPIMHHHSPVHEYRMDEALPSPRMYYNTNLTGRENPLDVPIKETQGEQPNSTAHSPMRTPQGSWKVVRNAAPMSIAAQAKRFANNINRGGPVNKKMPFIVGSNTGKSHSITVNLQKMFSALQQHSPTACTVCQEKREPSAHGTTVRRTNYNTRNDTRQDRLEKVIKTLEDEFIHLKIQYQKLVSLYEAIDLVKQPILGEQKTEISQQLNVVIQGMEKKADQIINLRDLRETKVVKKPQPNSTPMNLKILRGSQLIQEILNS
ncbi:hypothetical protein K7432_004847 [Basidiobolus ranarum]|uniref:Cep57 centrosome microtubule-binding domain-containing protein n=1 Tax=Basidiobolus ranarum TaxID=34480 RepID=A0ABR2WXG6_9FUNG